jgi:hypothetical protein
LIVDHCAYLDQNPLAVRNQTVSSSTPSNSHGCIAPQIKPNGEEPGMKRMLLAAALILAAAGAQAQTGTGSNPSTHSTSGYTRSTGTYVPPYVATNPNSTQRDNFGTSGNVNPYTGTVGTRTPRY